MRQLNLVGYRAGPREGSVSPSNLHLPVSFPHLCHSQQQPLPEIHLDYYRNPDASKPGHTTSLTKPRCVNGLALHYSYISPSALPRLSTHLLLPVSKENKVHTTSQAFQAFWGIYSQLGVTSRWTHHNPVTHINMQPLP